MGKVIKVIDLLNMIAKGEDLPRIIKYRRKKYYLHTKPDNLKWYWKMDIEGNWGDDLFIDVYGLNDEVEILDEEQEIDIQNIKELKIIMDTYFLTGKHDEDTLYHAYISNKEKINEIIVIQNKILQAVKYLDNKINKLESNT